MKKKVFLFFLFFFSCSFLFFFLGGKLLSSSGKWHLCKNFLMFLKSCVCRPDYLGKPTFPPLPCHIFPINYDLQNKDYVWKNVRGYSEFYHIAWRWILSPFLLFQNITWMSPAQPLIQAYIISGFSFSWFCSLSDPQFVFILKGLFFLIRINILAMFLAFAQSQCFEPILSIRTQICVSSLRLLPFLWIIQQENASKLS